MTWARIDDDFFTNRKVRPLGRNARLLYLAALVHCNACLTDGEIIPNDLAMLAAYACLSPVELEAAAVELTQAGLWDRDGSSYWVHDFLEYNPSRAEVADRREKRAAAARRDGRRSALARSEAEHVAEHVAEQNANPVPRSPVPGPQIPTPSLASESELTRAAQPEPEPDEATPAVSRSGGTREGESGALMPRNGGSATQIGFRDDERLTREIMPAAKADREAAIRTGKPRGDPENQRALWSAYHKQEPEPLTRSGRGAANRAVLELDQAGVRPDEVPRLIDAYRNRYPEAVMTPNALAKHLHELRPRASPLPIAAISSATAPAEPEPPSRLTLSELEALQRAGRTEPKREPRRFREIVGGAGPAQTGPPGADGQPARQEGNLGAVLAEMERRLREGRGSALAAGGAV